jgi:hypothetical protein
LADPGKLTRKERKLEKRRVEVLSSITGDKLRVELMALRPRSENDPLDEELLKTVLRRLADIEAKATIAALEDDLEDLEEDGEVQGLFAAYFCPSNEVQDEGVLAIDTLEGWGIPKTSPKKLKDLFSSKLENAVTRPHDARGALYSIFSEMDAWGDFVDRYEDSTRRYRLWLFVVVLASIVLAVVSLHYASRYPMLIIAGLLLAGASGSSVSVMSKMPALEASISGELEAFGRFVYTRIGVGIVASLIGCGLLDWGVLPVSLGNQTFAQALNACAGCPASSCNAVAILIVLAIAMLLGFSERALTSFDRRMFGEINAPRKRREQRR